MAGAFGYKMIFTSIIFYTFLGFLLSLGGSSYLTASIPDFATITNGNFITQIWVVLTNPLSAIGIISWLTIGFLITDIYIVVTSLIP
jgi:hypothetical protein